mmetsp:Transcript_17873/g.33621  ORF Transcript_17873/g.33621 Transcript_17873/m.33621 type:complete len:275 (+) Transcript_17873:83-907(+)
MKGVIFCLIYFLFTAPLIRSLVDEIAQCSPASDVESKVSDLAFHHIVFVLAAWMGVLMGVYMLVRYLGERFRRVEQNVTNSKWPTLKYHLRNEAEHRTDCLFIVLFFGILLYPNILQPFALNTPFICWFLYYFLVYSVLFETCESMTKLTLTSSLLSNPIGLAIVVVSSGIIGGFVYHHMVCAVAVDDNGLIVHSGFWGSVAMQGILFFHPSEAIKLHIHHYYWPLSLLQLCIFVSSEVSLITASMLCAISMHGIAFFGVQPLIHHVDINKHNS